MEGFQSDELINQISISRSSKQTGQLIGRREAKRSNFSHILLLYGYRSIKISKKRLFPIHDPTLLLSIEDTNLS